MAHMWSFAGTGSFLLPSACSDCEIIYSHGKTQVVCSEDDILVSQEGMSKSFESGETVPQESDEAGR
jgi:ribosomal protein S27E